MENICGTCSKCGGPVALPVVWGGVLPPIPTCKQCGATKANPYGPVIPMEGGEKKMCNLELIFLGVGASVRTERVACSPGTNKSRAAGH